MGWSYLSIPKLQRLRWWSLGMDRQFNPTLCNWCSHLSMRGLKVIHVSKRGPCGVSLFWEKGRQPGPVPMYPHMGLLPDTLNCRLPMRRECRERLPASGVSDPKMHHDTCVTHVPWCMSGSLTIGFFWSPWRENVPGIPGACATRDFTYLVWGPWRSEMLLFFLKFKHVYGPHLTDNIA